MGGFRDYIDNPKKAYWHSAAWFASMIILAISLGSMPKDCVDIEPRIYHRGQNQFIIDSECTNIMGQWYHSNGKQVSAADSDLAVSVIFPILWIQTIISIILLFLAEKGRSRENKKVKAKERESAKDYVAAIGIWEELGEIREAARVRTLKSEQGAVKVTQKVVHGDEVTKTEIKDSVVSKSSIGGGYSKMQELKDLAKMKKEGLISDEEYEKMKQDIIG